MKTFGLKDKIVVNGKIVCECEVECEKNVSGNDELCEDYITETLCQDELLDRACLDYGDIYNYDNGNDLYALHISNLKVFDKPLELSELLKYTQSCYGDNHITKAPSNMCYVWHNGELKVLIPCSSTEYMNTLNGKQTIIVRKKILKGMI